MSSLRKYVGISLLILSVFAVVISNVNAESGDMPIISFTDPTPDNGTITTQKYAYINTTIINSTNTTAFIDWNSSLVGWWRFNNETGESSTFFRDWSNWGNNGTCSGTTCPISTSGMFGNALSFDGVNDYINIGSSPSLNTTDATTVEAWIYPRADFVGYAAHPINKWSSTTDANVVLYYFGNTSGINRTIRFYANRGGVWGSISAGYKVELNRWYHIALSYNSTSGGQLYINGTPVGALEGSGKLASNTRTLNIGGGSGDYFNGTIDEVRIHSRALSPDEIKASYDAGTYRLYRNFINMTEGVYNYRAYVQNIHGIVNQTETRTLNIVPIPVPSISFTNLTPTNGTVTTQKYAYINTTISNSSNTTAFIDWNKSLVGWWRFNNETGESSTFLRDWSNWGNNGTCSGTTCPISTSGMFGNALSFDGVNDYINIGSSPSLNTTDAITIETWIYPKSDFIGYAAHPINKWSSTTDANVVLYYFGNTSGINRTIRFYANRGGVWGSISAGYKVELNKWYHIVVSYNSTGGGQLYVNGVPVGALEGSGKLASNMRPLRIGGGSADYFNGTIDEVRIHNRALSPEEIKASYNTEVYKLYRNFTNLTEGVYNYRAYVQNSYGIVNQTEIRTLNITPIPIPSISFTNPTPADRTITTQKYVYINTTILNSSNTTAFIDWNNSLVGWWRFNNESGESSTLYRDWSSRENNATCSGSGCPVSTPGMFGNALSFDGVNDYLNAGNSPSLNITEEITVEAWIYPKSDFVGYAAHPINKWSSTTDANVVLYYFGNTSGINRTIRFYANRGGTWGSISAGYKVELNKLYHIALSYNSTSGGQLYINGTPIGTLEGSGKLASNTRTLNIGGGSGDYFNGTIDEVRIHNRALSPDEIKASYDAGIYRLYRNFTNLTERVYNYRAYVQNSYGIVNQTETRTLNITTSSPVLCNDYCSFTVNYITS